jgi:hypothetical protein
LLKGITLRKEEKILEQIQTMERHNPSAFWNLINSLKSRKSHNTNISVEIFQEYFKTLHQGIENKHLNKDFKAKVEAKIENLKSTDWVTVLDQAINHDEIKKCAQGLKNKKACGSDSILNEMIKISLDTMILPLSKTFNHILNSRNFQNPGQKDILVLFTKRKAIVRTPQITAE